MTVKLAVKVVTPGVLHRPSGVTLAAISPDLVTAAVQDKWFDDEQVNRLAGFGLGDDGRVLAYETFKSIVQGVAPATGIYRRGAPAGVLMWTPKHQDGRRVTIHMWLSPEARGYGVGPAALDQWLGVAYKDGVYRVESELLSINKPLIKGLQHFGFHREARLTSAWWMDDNLYDLVVLRLLRRDWER